MKPLAECLELISGKRPEEFAAEHPHPVLIGLGVIAGELQRNPAKAAGTMFVNLSASPDAGQDGLEVNAVHNIQKVSQQTPLDGIYVGSGSENDIAIADSSISKTHAHFVVGNGHCSLVDHGSTNGSYINGSALETGVVSVLKGGDIITLGRLSFTYYDAMSFAKLLTVQAMAHSRSRRAPPRTPGSVRSTVPLRPSGPSSAAPPPWTQANQGGLRSTSVVPAPGGESAPWSPPQQGQAPVADWQQRAVGRLPDPGQSQGYSMPAPENTSPLPAEVPARRSWFARLLLRLSRWLQRLAGE